MGDDLMVEVIPTFEEDESVRAKSLIMDVQGQAVSMMVEHLWITVNLPYQSFLQDTNEVDFVLEHDVTGPRKWKDLKKALLWL
jgi:hypothetical protein